MLKKPNTGMFVKIFILNGNGGFNRQRSDLVQINNGAFLVLVNFVEQARSGAVVDFGALGNRAVGELVGLGKSS